MRVLRAASPTTLFNLIGRPTNGVHFSLCEPHSYGGGKHKPPRSVDEALRITARMAASWKGWVDVLKEEHRISIAKRRTKNQLPIPVGLKILRIQRAAKRLEDEITAALKKKPQKRRKRTRSIAQ